MQNKRTKSNKSQTNTGVQYIYQHDDGDDNDNYYHTTTINNNINNSSTIYKRHDVQHAKYTDNYYSRVSSYNLHNKGLNIQILQSRLSRNKEKNTKRMITVK